MAPNNNYKYFLFAVAAFFMLVVTDSFAQPFGGGGGPPPGVPIDGGVAILAALGLGFGARKLYIMDKNKGE